MSGLIRLERHYRAQLEDGASAAEAVTYVDRYGRTVASCRADVNDIGEWLVGGGLALDWPRYSKGRYSMAQRQAESVGRGVWAGSYVEPWQYRACVRAGGHPAECSDDAAVHP